MVSFRTAASRLQQRWIVEQGHTVGPSPTRLAMPDAEKELWNFLTPAIGTLVRSEHERNRFVRDEASKKLFGHPRLFDNTLSSQPLCFNLLGELALDTNLATKVFAPLFPNEVERVQAIWFEYSPARRDPRYLGNRTAADAFVVHTTTSGGRGFLAIETKYVETMAGESLWNEERYGPKATRADAWLDGPPTDARLSQITLDHLLALSMLSAGDGWERGRFLFVSPASNATCQSAAVDYAAALNAKGLETFAALTIEQFHAALAEVCRKPWVAAFYRRYLDMGAVT